MSCSCMCICVCFFFLHVILMEVMVSLCLSGVNPHHLAVIGKFFFYTGTWNGLITLRMKNNPSLYLTSISTSKPQIAPIKALVWHAHTNTQLFDLISLVTMSGRRVIPFHIGLNGHLFALIHQGSQHKCICLWYMYLCPRCLCVLTKGTA